MPRIHLAARLRAASFLAASLLLGAAGTASAADPFASNNGLYPASADDWNGPYRAANFRYPATPPEAGWTRVAPREPLTVADAPAYVARLKQFVAASLRDMIDKPDAWNGAGAGWHDMPWMGESQTDASGRVDATGGREALLGSFSGQVILKNTFGNDGPSVDMQNHTVIYYDATAATMLRKLWADPFNPNRTAVTFPEGAMVVKAGAASPTASEWPVLDGAAVWNVFRPPVADVIAKRANPGLVLVPRVTPLRVLQFDVIVKDSVASPQTGWVFSTFIYDKNAPGKSTWDKLVPLGAMWGNDPQFARQPGGRDPGGEPLRETWINASAPAFAMRTLGWGGRLSGPIDVSLRHQVLLTTGERLKQVAASSCMSCHGTAQFPMVANLYPSPNKTFPPEGQTFPMFPPGSERWAEWFKNRAGNRPQDANLGAVGLDYDMLIMFALNEFDRVSGSDRYVQKLRRVH